MPGPDSVNTDFRHRVATIAAGAAVLVFIHVSCSIRPDAEVATCTALNWVGFDPDDASQVNKMLIRIYTTHAPQLLPPTHHGRPRAGVGLKMVGGWATHFSSFIGPYSTPPPGLFGPINSMAIVKFRCSSRVGI